MTSRHRPIAIFVGLALLGLVLAVWALAEARTQRAETSEVLGGQARVLASVLGPSLAGASAAARELDELFAWRLLDAAHLVARLQEAGVLTAGAIEEIVDEGELDSVVLIARDGRNVLQAGEDVPAGVLKQVHEAIRGDVEDVILDSATEDGVEHFAVASKTLEGEAILVRIHAANRHTFSRQLGVENLLDMLLRTEGVIFLSFREGVDGQSHSVTWDGGPVPPRMGDGSGLREVRGRTVFEVEVPVASPAGTRSFLRVGLDGAPLVRAAVSATRRTVLIGVVLVVFSLSLVGVALVMRWRALEREESGRRLAEAEAARRSGERLASAGALAAGLAHEVRSPLNAIVVAAQRIERKQPAQSECHSFAGTIRSEVRRLDMVLRQFLDLARPVASERGRTDMRALADEVRQLLSTEAEAIGVTLGHVRGSGTAVVDADSIRRSMINLVRNAIQASSRGGTVDLLLEEHHGGVRIQVLDRGKGIDPAQGERLFDAFVTTRADGVGLGLALVRRTAEEHGGSCRIENRPGGGAGAELWLPGTGEGGSAE